MAKSVKKEKKSSKPKIKPEDNPALVNVGGKLCLRVFEDFFVEDKLPKWQSFMANKAALLAEISASYLEDEPRIRRYIKDHPSEEKDIRDRLEGLRKMEKVLSDDRWGIQSKHENEVTASLAKMVVYYGRRPSTLAGKLSAFARRLFGGKEEKLVPAEVAFADLKEHMELTSSEELMQAKSVLDSLMEKYARSGQYTKAETVKKLVPQLAHELAIANSGYVKFVTEEQMIEFVQKSERGVRVEFLRYYEGDIPDDVVKKKADADGKMVFDNYVVAYYGDFVKEAKKAVKKAAVAKKEAETRARRDPILFGVVKQTRRLYYICDWVTPEDDLTLEKLEGLLGVDASRLFNPGDSAKVRDATIQEMDHTYDRTILSAVNNSIHVANYDSYALGVNSNTYFTDNTNNN